MNNYFKRIKSAWDFAKVGWNDHNWDHFYLIKLNLFKLKRMEKFFLSDKTHIEAAPKVAKEIRQVIDQLELQSMDEVPEMEKAYTKFREKTGEQYFRGDSSGAVIPDWAPPEKTENEKYTVWFSWYENAKNLKQNEKWKKESCDLYEKTEVIKFNALKMAFAQIGRKCQTWWD